MQKAIRVSEAIYRYAEDIHRNPELRNKAGFFHVSDLVGDVGWNCNRYFGYIRLGEPQINETRTFSPDIQRTFWIGEGIELGFKDVIPKAMEKDLERVGGKMISFHYQYSFRDQELGIVGHVDFVAHYEIDGLKYTHVIDTKSTSSTSQDKRQVAKNTLLSRPDAYHDRQVSVYLHYLKQDKELEADVYVANLTYIEKAHTHRLSDAWATSERTHTILSNRIKKVDKELSEGKLPLPTSGSHCRSCQWSELCQKK